MDASCQDLFSKSKTDNKIKASPVILVGLVTMVYGNVRYLVLAAIIENGFLILSKPSHISLAFLID